MTDPIPMSTPRKISYEFLHQEAQYIAEMFKILNHTYWHKNDHEYYIISLKWLNKWKQYVNYDEVVRSMENKIDIKNINHKPAVCPGTISNETLILEQKDYFHDFNNLESHFNIALRENVQRDRDFIIVSKDIWDYLNKRYGGIKIIRK